MDYVALAKKDILFHGIWKAGYRVSDNLIKSIGSDVSSKPSQPCTLRLTPAGLSLELPPSPDGNVRKTNHVSFDSLRDIVVNYYQPKCLIIIYLDPNSRFSVMACSSQQEKDLEDICRAYKDHKNFLLQSSHSESQSQESRNWMLRQNQNIHSDGKAMPVKEKYLKSNGFVGTQEPGRYGSTVSGEMMGSSQGSISRNSYRHVSDSEDSIYEDVFFESRYVVMNESEDLIREPVNRDGQPNAFNVGVQTTPDDDENDGESITSATALQSTQSEAGTASDAGTSSGERSSEISAEVYHTRNKAQGNRNVAAVHSTTIPPHDERVSSEIDENNLVVNHHPDDDNHLVGELTNGHDNDRENTDGDNTYSARSAGTQTVNSGRGAGRYKKQMVRKTSNSYKEKSEASKTRNFMTGPRSPTSWVSGPHVPASNPRSSITSGSTQRHVLGSNVGTIKQVKRTVSLGSTTVIKPIESVYRGWATRRSLGARSQRPIIIYTPIAPSRAV